MSLLSSPPEWASWWTYRQIAAFFSEQLSPLTICQLMVARADFEGRDPLVSQMWHKLDFCAQAEIAQAVCEFEEDMP